MKIAIISILYGFVIWATNWIELYFDTDFMVDVATLLTFHLGFLIGLAFMLREEFKKW